MSAPENHETESSTAPPETPSGPGKADNSGAIEANQPDPELSVIEPAAD